MDTMNWNNCYSDHRPGVGYKASGPRTQYQRDFDRIIFSPPFQRLQKKTQVFPLPGSVFVHNRLTHSLEVASVGRSLGTLAGQFILETEKNLSEDAKLFYNIDLPGVIAAGCLIHDIGNPAFGHSGESAISHFFIENSNLNVDGNTLKSYFTNNEWLDITLFEGNANALRLLTKQYQGKMEGGLRLTYATLASILKYPCESAGRNKKIPHRKKFGFFQAEKELAIHIMSELHFHQESETPLAYKRHPFVYFVEAADDVCYRIVDLEDAHRLGIFHTELVTELLLNVLKDIEEKNRFQRIAGYSKDLADANEKIAFLRSICINAMTNYCVKVFKENYPEILNGTFLSTLSDEMAKICPALDEIEKLSIEKIYNHSTVIEIEIAGFNVMSEMLELFVPAAIKASKSDLDKMIHKLIPRQYYMGPDQTPYENVMSVLDYVSGMTDDYATDLYRKLKGIEIPKHR